MFPSDEEESKSHQTFTRLFEQTPAILDFDESQSNDEDDVTYSMFAQLLSTTTSYDFIGAHFTFALLEKDSMWISGWDFKRNHVLWQVKVPNCEVLLQKTINHSNPYSQAKMVSFAKGILFTEKGDGEIYSFNTQTQTFETIFRNDIQIDAMCCNNDHLYIFQKKHPDVIQFLDSKFQPIGHIPTGFEENLPDCAVDLCTITASAQKRSSSEYRKKHQHVCIISISNLYNFFSPSHHSVRAVSERGLIWQVDSQRYPELRIRFNPCSVSTCEEGDVFIADNGADRV